MTGSAAPDDDSRPIGVFDSGLGGLTVARAIGETLPHERLVYLGDTARVPYGTRSAETVIRYARRCAQYLRGHAVKMLVVACNTVSAVALDMLRVELDVPVLGVVEPGAEAAIEASAARRIGVLATPGTIASGAYVRAVAGLDTRAEVFARPAPLLVPLVEEGWMEGTVPQLTVRRYLEPFAGSGIDALVLGCTHYPLLRELLTAEIRACCGASVSVVDSGHATAAALASLLEERGLASSGGDGAFRLLVTDLPGRFSDVASRFLARDVDDIQVEAVDL